MLIFSVFSYVSLFDVGVSLKGEKAFKTHPLLICDLTNTRIYFEGIETADLSIHYEGG